MINQNKSTPVQKQPCTPPSYSLRLTLPKILILQVEVDKNPPLTFDQIVAGICQIVNTAMTKSTQNIAKGPTAELHVLTQQLSQFNFHDINPNNETNNKILNELTQQRLEIRKSNQQITEIIKSINTNSNSYAAKLKTPPKPQPDIVPAKEHSFILSLLEGFNRQKSNKH